MFFNLVCITRAWRSTSLSCGREHRHKTNVKDEDWQHLETGRTTECVPGDAAFAKGRDFAAWLGLVPKQMSTGDRTIKLARIAWTVLAQRRNYETRVVTGAA